MENIQIYPQDVAMVLDWLKNHGGLAIWDCANLANLGKRWYVAVDSGRPQHWDTGNLIRTITDINEIGVRVPKVVKRFHVATRMGDQGFMIKVTSGGTRRIEKEVAKAKEKFGSGWYEFDYGSYENCVILTNDKITPLSEWKVNDGPTLSIA